MDENSRKIYEKYGINPEECEKENQEILTKRYEELDNKNRQILEETFQNGLLENFDNFKYILRENRFYYFKELESNIWQIAICLIVKAYSASITLTNHVLERTLKLALIQKKSGIPKNFTNWNKNYESSHKYSSWTMENTVAESKILGIITEEQVENLTEFRRSMRNGFSNYDPTKILKDSNDIKEMTIKSLESKVDKNISFNFKKIPMLQNAYVNMFAEENAEFYFDYVIQIIEHIERHFKTEYYNEYEQK